MNPSQKPTAQEVAAKAMSRAWNNMHTNEPLGYQLMLAQAALDALTEAEYAVVPFSDLAQDLVKMRDWQQSALTVITAANAFISDCATGDGDPRKLAAALIESGFDGRVQR